MDNYNNESKEALIDMLNEADTAIDNYHEMLVSSREKITALRAELEKVHALLRAWRATVSIERDSRGENPVIATMVHNNQGRELNAAGVALAEYVDSLEGEDVHR